MSSAGLRTSSCQCSRSAIGDEFRRERFALPVKWRKKLTRCVEQEHFDLAVAGRPHLGQQLGLDPLDLSLGVLSRRALHFLQTLLEQASELGVVFERPSRVAMLQREVRLELLVACVERRTLVRASEILQCKKNAYL